MIALRKVSIWTDERTEELKSLRLRGLSASQCAKALGFGIPRNAVIGRASRLGMAGNRSAKIRKPPKSKPRKVTPMTPAKPVIPPIPPELNANGVSPEAKQASQAAYVASGMARTGL